MPRIEPIPMDELSSGSREIVEAGVHRTGLHLCVSDGGLHSFLHTLDVSGNRPPVIEYSPEQVDGVVGP